MTLEADSSLFDDGRIATAQHYDRAGRRFCHKCETSVSDPRCPWCGRFTTTTAPPGWFETSTKKNFTDQLSTAVGHGTVTVLPRQLQVVDEWA